MKTIALSAITVKPGRQRKHFDAAKLHEFSDRISAEGLLHPLVLRIEGDSYILVAGERRLRAITDLADLGVCIKHDGSVLPCGFVPYTLFEDLDPLAAEEAELSENINREDLTWQERAAAHAHLKSLRDRQAAARGDTPPSVAELAVEVRGSGEGGNQEITRRELIIARHLDDPEVKAAKSVYEAWKLLKKKESSAKDRALGELVGRTFTAEQHNAINADSISWLAECPAETFDVILTDPPYGMNADQFGDSGGLAAGAHGYKDDAQNFFRILGAATQHFGRITKPQAHLYWFCDIDFFEYARRAFTEAGWEVFRTPLIWYKKTGMRAPWPHSGPQRKYEVILYAVKGKRPVTKMAGDVLDFAPDDNMGHAAQKPVALFQELLTRSVHPGDAVLDPFCGSGPIFPAAHELKCRATGIEMDQASYGIAVKRIEQLKAQMELGL